MSAQRPDSKQHINWLAVICSGVGSAMGLVNLINGLYQNNPERSMNAIWQITVSLALMGLL